MSSFAYWARNDLPEMRLSGDVHTDRQENICDHQHGMETLRIIETAKQMMGTIVDAVDIADGDALTGMKHLHSNDASDTLNSSKSTIRSRSPTTRSRDNVDTCFKTNTHALVADNENTVVKTPSEYAAMEKGNLDSGIAYQPVGARNTADPKCANKVSGTVGDITHANNVRLFDVVDNVGASSKLPSKPFTSWRALVYYLKSGEVDKESRASSGVKATQRHRKALSAKLNSSLTMDVDVDNDLQCPICLELYTYPIILPCSHVLCRSPCAEHLFDFNFIRCPVCRDNCYVSGGIASLPRVIALENIIDRYKNEQKKEKNKEPEVVNKTGSAKQLSLTSPPVVSNGASLAASATSSRNEPEIKCQNCKNGVQRRAKKFCVTCSSHYCGSCLRLTHPNKEPYTSHEFTEPNASTTNVVPKCSASAGNRKTSSTTTPSSTNRKVIDCYCRLCMQPFSASSDEGRNHTTHPVIAIEEAYREYKSNIGDNSDKLSNSQSKVVTSLKSLKDRLKDVQHVLTRRRDDINTQCDALLAEVENKRSYFLADLEYEERVRQSALEDGVKLLEQLLGSSQGLQGYVRDMLAADKPQFMEIANTLNERLMKATLDFEGASDTISRSMTLYMTSYLYYIKLMKATLDCKRLMKATLDCEGASGTVPHEADVLQNKVVDCRREKVVLRELTYLAAPSTPIIDVTRCSRSENAVVLALCPPPGGHEIVDQYEIHFCSEAQKNIELEETQIVKNLAEESCSSKLCSGSPGMLVILVENLCRATTYFFCLTAVNAAGKSASSEVVQCTTLAQQENVIPVPVIIDSLCKRFTSSLQVFSSSPMDVAAEQKISHFLLYRQPARHRVWQCAPMYGREEHRLFGLEPATEYELLVLAYNLRGECQLSNKVTMETEVAAGY